MLESVSKGSPFTYEKLSPEEMEQRGILGRLTGVIADFTNPTRNGRLYGEKLWDNVFNDEIMKEKIASRTVLGELEHPTDRTEIDPSKACICLAEQPKKKDGKLYGVFDILNTPNGQVLNSLCQYGTNIGVSSRGTGDLMGMNQDEVDPSTYDCQCWDAVLLPAVKEARMDYVNESLNGKTLRESLNELVESADGSAKTIMQESVDRILNEADSEKKDCNIDKGLEDDKEVAIDESIVEELQEALELNRKLDKKIVTLNERLSVGYAKEMKLEEELQRAREQIEALTKDASRVKDGNAQASSLEESFMKKEKTLNERLSNERNQKRSLSERLQNETRRLEESIAKKDERIIKLEEGLSKTNKQLEDCKKKLNASEESVSELKKDSKQIRENYSRKLEKSNKLAEKYKKQTKYVVEKYIESQAKKLGVTSNEIKNRLPENYNLQDIDKICEGLQRYSMSINGLPFDGMLNESSRFSTGSVLNENDYNLTPRDSSIEVNDLDMALVKNL